MAFGLSIAIVFFAIVYQCPIDQYFCYFFALIDETLEMGSPREGLGTYEFMEDTNENNSYLFFNPQVEDQHVPKIGQEFESLEDAYNFYNNYAKQAGFSVQSYCQQRSKTSNEILRKGYVCYKEGVYSKEVSNGSERR